MKIKLKLNNPTELNFLLIALKERHNRVLHDEELWDAWELTVLTKLITQIKELIEKWGV